MSLGRQQAGQLTGTLTGPPERGHGIAAGIRVNQSFQRLDQLGVVLDQRLPSSSRVPYSLNGQRWLSKAVDSPIDGRTRESAKTGDAGNTPSSQLLCIDGSDKVLLSLIQVRKQQAVFLLKFFCCAHTDSVTQCASFVTIINLRALIDVMRRLGGSGKGEPVIQLQTAFGGGKTHTLLTQYHLLKKPNEVGKLPEIQAILTTAGLKNIPAVNVACLVGTALDAASERTFWGEMAYQLDGGKEGKLYGIVAENDRLKTAPGTNSLGKLLEASGPTLILLDEILVYLVKVRTDS